MLKGFPRYDLLTERLRSESEVGRTVGAEPTAHLGYLRPVAPRVIPYDLNSNFAAAAFPFPYVRKPTLV